MVPVSIGKFKASDSSGIGIEPDPETLDSYTLQKYRIDKKHASKSE